MIFLRSKCFGLCLVVCLYSSCKSDQSIKDKEQFFSKTRVGLNDTINVMVSSQDSQTLVNNSDSQINTTGAREPLLETSKEATKEIPEQIVSEPNVETIKTQETIQEMNKDLKESINIKDKEEPAENIINTELKGKDSPKEDIASLSEIEDALEHQGSKKDLDLIEEETIEKESVLNKVPVVENNLISIHEDWDKMLQLWVDGDGLVNYSNFVKEENRLDAYLALLNKNTPSTEWSKNKELAYWINLYNAYTIKLIVNNYPLSSIKETHEGSPWDHKWIVQKNKTYSLNDIEHKIMRAKFNEPRIHFAVNCAAASCPPLLNEAWQEDKIEGQLEMATKQFISNPKYNSFAKGKAKVSKIFEWYKEDFGDLKSYLSRYVDTEIKSIAFQPYNWELNTQE